MQTAQERAAEIADMPLVPPMAVAVAKLRFRRNAALRRDFYIALADNSGQSASMFVHSLALIYDNDTRNGKHPMTVVGVLCRSWIRRLQHDGASYSMLFREWAPPADAIVLEAVAGGDFDEQSLRDLAAMSYAIGGWHAKMAMAFFPFFGALSFGVTALYLIGKHLVPQMERVFKNLDGATKFMFKVSTWLADGGVYPLTAALWVAPLVIFVTLPFWSGRLRSVFDDLWPWNLYREVQTGLVFRALAQLLTARGRRLPGACERIAQSASPYLRARLLAIAAQTDIAIGYQFDEAGMNFPAADVRRQLRQLKNTNKIVESLRRISDDALARAEKQVKEAATMATLLSMLILMGMIGWLQHVSSTSMNIATN